MFAVTSVTSRKSVASGRSPVKEAEPTEASVPVDVRWKYLCVLS